MNTEKDWTNKEEFHNEVKHPHPTNDVYIKQTATQIPCFEFATDCGSYNESDIPSVETVRAVSENPYMQRILA